MTAFVSTAVAALAGVITLAAPLAPARAEDAPPFQGAVGVGIGWQTRQDFGEQTRSNFVPEIVGMAYLPTRKERFFLRPAVRLGYSGLEQAPTPSSLSFREDDVSLTGELGLLRDGLVVPSLTLGGGLVLRRLDVETSQPIGNPDDALDDMDVLPVLHAQVGLGVPLAQGRVVIEPFARYEWLLVDPRFGWTFGADVSVRIF